MTVLVVRDKRTASFVPTFPWGESNPRHRNTPRLCRYAVKFGLADVAGDGALSGARPVVAAGFMQALCLITERLAQLHGSGWVHRDLKPGNVLRLPGQHSWTLMDFGCAARSGAALSLPALPSRRLGRLIDHPCFTVGGRFATVCDGV